MNTLGLFMFCKLDSNYLWADLIRARSGRKGGLLSGSSKTFLKFNCHQPIERWCANSVTYQIEIIYDFEVIS